MRGVDLVQELERRDEAVAAEAAWIAAAEAETEAVRERVERILDLRAVLPEALRRLGAAAARATEAAERARATVRDAEGGEDPRALATARAGLELAEARARQIADERARLERDAAAAEAELPELEATARDVSELLGVPAPAGTLESFAEWAPRARAAAFAGRARLEHEREDLIEQANEVAGALLGDPLVGTSIPLVRRRLERELG